MAVKVLIVVPIGKHTVKDKFGNLIRETAYTGLEAKNIKELRPISPAELAREVRIIKSKARTAGWDPPKIHLALDKLMEDTLIRYGHNEAVTLIRAQTRWYE